MEKLWGQRCKTRADVRSAWESNEVLSKAAVDLIASLRDETAKVELNFKPDRWIKERDYNWSLEKALYRALGNDPDLSPRRMLIVVQPAVAVNGEILIPGWFA